MPAPLHEALPSILERNLGALQDHNPELAERLLWPADRSHVELGNERPPTYRRRFEQLPLLLSEDRIAACVAEAPLEGSLLLFGLGLGDLAVQLVRNRPRLKVIAWDRDPALLRATLTRRDVSAALASGQLELRLGIDILDLLEPTAILEHPVLAPVYGAERSLLEDGLRERRVLLGQGGPVVDDVGDALRDAGFSVIPVELVRWSDDELALAIRRAKPEVVASVNYRPGLAELCASEGVPLVVWQVDASTDSLAPVEDPAGVHLFTFEEAAMATFQKAGLENVHYLPVAAHQPLRRRMDLGAEDARRYSARLTFVGSSMVGTAQDYRRQLGLLYGNWHPDGMDAIDELDSLLEAMLVEQRKDFSSFVVPELMEQHLGNFAAAVRRTVGKDPAMLVGEIAAAEQRRSWISQLGRFEIEVWGDEPWREVEGTGALYRGKASREELTKIYNGTLINVDIGRLYQANTISQRVFDVLGCGGFLIAQHSEALAAQFAVDEELVTYHTLDELIRKIAHYLAHPQEARAIADRGLAAVQERHTVAHRVQQILRTVRT